MVETDASSQTEPDNEAFDNEGPKLKRDRSAIEFPYTDLETCVEMARMIRDRAGVSCEDEQLATWMGQTVTGGTFRSRMSASKMFGLVESQRGFVTLTALGLDSLDGEKSRATHITAFLRVPLYSAIYEQFKGHVLPLVAAIERQMVGLGVAVKQKDRARQTFTKSALYAGFIDQQTGRFIKPAVGTPLSGQTDASLPEAKVGGGGDEPPPLDPFIQGLLRKLPKPDTPWSIQDQAKWLRTAASIFGLIYPADGSITIQVTEDHGL